MATEVYSYLGAGQVFLRNRSAATATGLLPIGEVATLELSVATDKKELASHTQTGGGLADAVARISGVTLAMDVNSLSPENVALALRGDVSAVTSATVTDEVQTAYLGALVKFDKVPDLDATITVTNSAGDTTYVLGTDYDLSPAGIRVLATGTITAAESIKVSYSGKAHDVIEMLTNSGDEYELVFEGLNEARSDKPVIVTIHRIKFEPTSGLGFIGDDFATLSLAGDVLKDAAITASGLSKFATISMV